MGNECFEIANSYSCYRPQYRPSPLSLLPCSHHFSQPSQKLPDEVAPEAEMEAGAGGEEILQILAVGGGEGAKHPSPAALDLFLDAARQLSGDLGPQLLETALEFRIGGVLDEHVDVIDQESELAELLERAVQVEFAGYLPEQTAEVVQLLLTEGK